MSGGSPIFDEIEQDALRRMQSIADWFHHDKEMTMTTPQAQISTPAPQRNVLADLSYVLGQLDSNRLVSYLFSSGHGKLLSAQEIDHVIGLVSAIEAGRQPASDVASELPRLVTGTAATFAPANA